MPTFTALDIPLETNLDEAGTCNAYYSGNSINFYAEGLSANGTDYCENTGKISDVVYHEYGMQLMEIDITAELVCGMVL